MCHIIPFISYLAQHIALLMAIASVHFDLDGVGNEIISTTRILCPQLSDYYDAWSSDADEWNMYRLSELQVQYKCCGLLGPVSWGLTSLPDSCCVSSVAAGACTPDKAIAASCQTALSDACAPMPTVAAVLHLGPAIARIVVLVCALIMLYPMCRQPRNAEPGEV